MFDWKATLSKVAPLAATMIGGPWGGLAASAIGAVFGHEGDTPPDEQQMAQMIAKANPNQLIELKKIDAELRIRMRELDIKEQDLVFEDKNSARDMQKAVKSNMPAVLAIMLTVGFFGVLTSLLFVEIPEVNKATVYMMIGSLGTAWIGSVQFYNGTTHGSGLKNTLFMKK